MGADRAESVPIGLVLQRDRDAFGRDVLHGAAGRESAKAILVRRDSVGGVEAEAVQAVVFHILNGRERVVRNPWPNKTRIWR